VALVGVPHEILPSEIIMGDLTKNFSTSEFECPCCKVAFLSPEFIALLQRVRELAGVPMSISSGYRCEPHNAAVGGVDSSAHCDGTAADIRCLSGTAKFAIIAAAIDVGFSRIGVSGTFVHLDMAENKPRYVLWTY
jgi:zinc D-Ala-D-Ala carboxypeptidase